VFRFNPESSFEPLIVTVDQKKFIAWNFQSKEELRSKVGMVDGMEGWMNGRIWMDGVIEMGWGGFGWMEG